MQSIYEAVGHGTWVKAEEASGAVVPDVIKQAAPPKRPSHTYGECAHGPSRCKVHAKVYRAMAAKNKKQQALQAAAAERDATIQVELHRQRTERMHAAAVR